MLERELYEKIVEAQQLVAGVRFLMESSVRHGHIPQNIGMLIRGLKGV